MADRVMKHNAIDGGQYVVRVSVSSMADRVMKPDDDAAFAAARAVSVSSMADRVMKHVSGKLPDT